MQISKKILMAVGAVVASVATIVADTPGDSGCMQGCHRDQYWKVDGKCIKAEKITCCVRAWAVAVGGNLTNIGADVDHWIYGDICVALCPEKKDSVAMPFQSTGSPEGLFGKWPECYCRPSGPGLGGGLDGP